MEPRVMTSDEQAAMKAFWHYHDRHRAAITEQLRRVAETIPDFVALLRSIPADKLAEQEKRGAELQRRALVEGDWGPYLTDLREQAAGYARAGVRFSAWLPLFTSLRDEIQRRLRKEPPGGPAETEAVSAGMNRFFDLTVAGLGEAYVEAKQTLILQQQQAIRELSTPVLQVRPGLLIIPIVGLVDTDRARHLTQALLRAVRDRRARAVVMDITGVPVVDSKVANHIVQACEAARLMGARVILTGISAEIAQALVTLGAELRGAQTLGDLQSGIEEAELILGYQALRHEAPPSANGRSAAPAPTLERQPENDDV